MLPSGEPDPGMLIERQKRAPDVLADFIKAIARHRHHERESDPPAL
jgi:catalase